MRYTELLLPMLFAIHQMVEHTRGMAMKVRVAIVAGLIIHLLIVELAIAGEIPREPLDRLWEQHMLEGKGGAYMNGQPEVVTTRPTPFARARRGKGAGSPYGLLSTEYAIEVKDFRGTDFFGLMRGGGWILLRGLLERIEIASGAIELYGKVVHRVHPGFFDHYFRPKEEDSYEFFLLVRTGTAQASILKRWTIPPNEIKWFIPKDVQESQLPEHIKKQQETSDVRGFLKYLPDTQEAEVTITGLTHPFVERFRVTLK